MLNYENFNKSDGVEIQIALRQWVQREFAQGAAYHITLNPHRQMRLSPAMSKYGGRDAFSALKHWDAQMNRRLIGKRWSKERNFPLHSRWIAFLEGSEYTYHWHLVFTLSESLGKERVRKAYRKVSSYGRFEPPVIGGKRLDRMSWLAHDCWKRTVASGTALAVRIRQADIAAAYCTKEQFNLDRYQHFIMSYQLKN